LQGGGQVVLRLRVGQAADAGDQRLGVDPHAVVLSLADETIAAAVSLPADHRYRRLPDRALVGQQHNKSRSTSFAMSIADEYCARPAMWNGAKPQTGF